MAGIAEGIDALEKKFIAHAYASYAAFIRDNFLAGFGAFVSIIPCETGLTQFNSRFEAAVPPVVGATAQSAKGASSPILGWRSPPSHIYRKPKRISEEITTVPENTKVDLMMPNTESIARQLMKSGTTTVIGKMTTSRMAFDEPEMQSYLIKHGLGDVDVLTIHVGDVIQNFTYGFKNQFKQRSQFKQPDQKVVESLAK